MTAKQCLAVEYRDYSVRGPERQRLGRRERESLRQALEARRSDRARLSEQTRRWTAATRAGIIAAKWRCRRAKAWP